MTDHPDDINQGFRVLAWNIRHGGDEHVTAIIDRVAFHHPGVAVLSEFHDENSDRLQDELDRLGLIHQFDLPSPPGADSVLIASRWPFGQSEALAPELGEAYRLPVVTVGAVTIVGAYFPEDDGKRAYWRAVADAARRRLAEPTLFVGDFHTGRHFIDEAGKTFKVAEGMDWMDAAGVVDLWRSRHPEGREFTWTGHKGNGFRLDHAFASPSLAARVSDVRYSHLERIDGVSDHSALIVDIAGGEFIPEGGDGPDVRQLKGSGG